MDPVEVYLQEMHEIRSTGGGVEETSYYPALSNLLNTIGKKLKPKVKCVNILKNTGAGNPDFGLFSADQFNRKSDMEPLPGQIPGCGVIEAKPTDDDSWLTADSKQVAKYWKRYSQVLVTNYRDFVFVGRDENEEPVILETYRLADNETDFWKAARQPRKTAKEHGERLVGYLRRVIQYSAALKNPEDLAWFLASYAREARARIEAIADLPGLAMLRQGLEEALGLKFEGEDGEHFFRATLIQTLFYGIFSSWVLWARQNRNKKQTVFNWHEAAWNLHVPMIAGLFEQIATPHRLKPLGIDEVLDWTGAVLNRVDKREFFRHFEEEHAVQYFYEPFLEAYDPELRKQLGVWYTPPEIIKYQVERIDTVLREELDIADGLADPNVVVLDPCCGTGGYLVEVIRKVHKTLDAKGGDALTAQQLKKAAIERIFGFEILPAPFVISHLQIGLLLRELGAPLVDKKHERAGVYLTNALTGWEPPKKPKDILPFPELQEEKDAAEKVKRETPILVILGNPPYNAFAGTSPEEEGGLVDVYKEGLNKPIKQGGWGIKKFNLDDLYIRFFRIAERRISKSGKGVVCYISNHSWISEPSFVVLRQHLIETFDKFWIENMHGNRKISEYGPDGKTSETIFAIRGFSAGIQQGVATSLWVKTSKATKKAATVYFRDNINASKAINRRKQLLATLEEKNITKRYKKTQPAKDNRYSFRPTNVSDHYLEWPKLNDLSESPQEHGPVVLRDFCLGAFEYETIYERMKVYFNSDISNAKILEVYKGLMTPAYGFNPVDVREKFIMEKVKFEKNKIIPYIFKPFDKRYYYNEIRYGLCCRPSPKLVKQIWQGNAFLISRSHSTMSIKDEGHPIYFSSSLGDYDHMNGHARFFPYWMKVEKKKIKGDDGMTGDMFGGDNQKETIKANLSKESRAYLKALKFSDPNRDKVAAEAIWMHCLAIGYSGAYLTENADGIRQDWPRVPLPDTKKILIESGALGRQIAGLLDTEAHIEGVTIGVIRKELGCIGLISRVDGGVINPDAGELDVTAGWGHAGKGGVCMPGKGNLVRRPYTAEEKKAISEKSRAVLGDETCDVYLNEKVFVKNVPAGVWEYYIGGYQVMKKWLSYREKSLLGRGLTMEEAYYLRDMARRLAGLVLLGPELDANYLRVKESTYAWEADKDYGEGAGDAEVDCWD